MAASPGTCVPARPGAFRGARGDARGGAGEGGGGGWREPATAARDGARRAPAHVSAAAPSRRTPRAPAPRAGGREGAQTGPARPRPGVPRAAGERSRRRRVHGGGSGGDGGLRRHRLRSHPPTMHSLATAAVSARLRAPPSGGGTALGMGPHCAGRAGRGSAAASGCGGNLRLWGGGVPVGSVPSASPAGPVWELPNSGCSLGAAPCRQCGLCLWRGSSRAWRVSLLDDPALPRVHHIGLLPSPLPAVLPLCVWMPPVANQCYKVS